MNLEQDLYKGQIGVNVYICMIDKDSHGRLGYPGDHFIIDIPRNTVIPFTAIAESIGHGCCCVGFPDDALLPGFNLREHTKVPLLDTFNLFDE